MRRLLANLALALAAVTLFLALCEGVLWLAAPPPRLAVPKDMYVHRDGYWQIVPNFTGTMDNRVDFRAKVVSADAQGRRVVPAAPAQAPRRVLAIGDSQTFGHGLSDDESWPNQLQLALGSGVRVENHAIPAVNVDQYTWRLNHLLPGLKPGDLVLVGLSWNDLITPQSVTGEQIRVVEGYLVKAGAESEQAQAERIRLFEATGMFIPPLSDLKGALEALSQHSALVHFLYPRAKAVYYRLRRDRPVETLFAMGVPETNIVLLAGMRTKAEARGARFAVVLLPDKMFFEDAAWQVYSAGGRDYPAQNLMGHLAMPLCARFELTCLDTFDLLHAHQHDPVAYEVDGHYNPAGARLIAGWLAQRLGL